MPSSYANHGAGSVSARSSRRIRATIQIVNCALLAICLTYSVSGRIATAQAPPRPWLEDAELHEITFANPLEGWAVGDRGVIWHTTDGGAKWSLQRTDVNVRLNGVSFVDARRGWAVGGETYAYLPGSRGVVLSTADGGETWQRDESTLLSGVRGVRGFTTQHLRLWGKRSAIFPNSMSWTADGGRSWSPMGGELMEDCRDAAFLSPNFGAVITSRGQVHVASERATRPARRPETALRQPWRIRFVDDRRGVIVGDGGLVWLTHDGGETWQECKTLDPKIASLLDFRALAVRGAHIWAAGSPGTLIAHSADFGKTWELLSTSHTIAVKALTFTDESHGWACGALGTILATQDGGRTWRVQRSGGSRAAVMGILADAENAPWELFAQTCGQHGALGHAHFLVRSDWLRPDAEDRCDAENASRAMSAVGGSSADRSWRFPIPRQASAETMVDMWNAIHADAGLEAMERELVAEIRAWRPDVLVTHAPPADGADPLAFVVNQMTLKAAERAADATYQPEHFEQLQLKPWKVNKIYGALPPDRASGERLAPAQLAPELGRSLGQQAALARAIVNAEVQPTRDMLGFRLISSRLPESASGRGFLGGVNLVQGESARRADPNAGRDGDQLRQLAVRQRNLQAIVGRLNDERNASAVLAQLPEMVRPLGADYAAPLLFELGARQHQAGRTDTAAECYSLLAERYPDHPLAAPSTTWLLQRASSVECLHRANQQAPQALARTARSGQVVLDGGKVELAGFDEGEEPASPNAVPLPTSTPQAASMSRIQALHRQLSRNSPTLASAPFVLFPMSTLARAAESADLRAAQHLTPGSTSAAWRRAAAAEAWLTKGAGGDCPMPNWRCRRVAARPRLDGMLNDELWSGGAVIDLLGATATDEWPTSGMAAYDDQFLYLAFACARSPQLEYAEKSAYRERDVLLNDADRIEISLDVDRDYVTAWQLAVDSRGRVRDACWGDASWNPKWYVATHKDEVAWYVEAAIPFTALTPQAPGKRAAWCAKVKRVAPGVGEQSWAAPAVGDTTLEDGGWLVFE